MARAGETPAILDLIAASYHRHDGPSRLRYWQWKHEANPFGVSPCLVAEVNGRLVGVRLFLRWIWKSGTTNVHAVRAVDTATLPEWRGRGIFSRLTMQLVEQVQREGVSLIFNTPNNKSMPGYLKMGWAQVGRIPLWIRPVRLGNFVRRALSAAPPQQPAFTGLQPVARVLGDSRLPAFLADVAPSDERYHTVRTLPYLRWRYADIPDMTYWARFDMVGDAGAFVIARGRVRGRLREVTISELLVTPSERGVQAGRTVLAELLRHSDADYVAACSASGTPERSVLIRAGFIPAPRLGPHFTARRLATLTLDPLQWDNWRCAIGDLELF